VRRHRSSSSRGFGSSLLLIVGLTGLLVFLGCWLWICIADLIDQRLTAQEFTSKVFLLVALVGTAGFLLLERNGLHLILDESERELAELRNQLKAAAPGAREEAKPQGQPSGTHDVAR
jgi:hypothetical protein